MYESKHQKSPGILIMCGKFIMKAALVLNLISFFGGHAYGQNLLTIDEAIRIGLSKNYQVLIDSNVMRAAQINNSPGSAGFLPRLDLSGDATYSGQNINQKFSSGTEIDKNNVSANAQSAGAYLTWTLFDGLNMFATAKFLRLQEEQAGTLSKENVQRLMADIINSYYAVVQRKQYLRLLDSSIKYYDVALTTAKNLQLNGKGTRQQVLQAQIDRNAAQPITCCNRIICKWRKLISTSCCSAMLKPLLMYWTRFRLLPIFQLTPQN